MEHPEVYQRLRQELDAALPTLDSVVTRQIVSELPYLNAIINESLRVRPIGTSTAPRVVPSEGLDVDGYHIPGGVRW